MKHLINKIELKICKMYIKLYIKRVLNNQAVTESDYNRFLFCLKHITEA